MAAFGPARTEDELMNLTLGLVPASIFLVVVKTNIVKPALVPYVSRTSKNIFMSNNVSEFFCLMGIDDDAAKLKISPYSFFLANDKGIINFQLIKNRTSS